MSKISYDVYHHDMHHDDEDKPTYECCYCMSIINRGEMCLCVIDQNITKSNNNIKIGRIVFVVFSIVIIIASIYPALHLVKQTFGKDASAICRAHQFMVGSYGDQSAAISYGLTLVPRVDVKYTNRADPEEIDLVSKNTFVTLNGFDKNYNTVYQTIELCLNQFGGAGYQDGVYRTQENNNLQQNSPTSSSWVINPENPCFQFDCCATDQIHPYLGRCGMFMEDKMGLMISSIVIFGVCSIALFVCFIMIQGDHARLERYLILKEERASKKKL